MYCLSGSTIRRLTNRIYGYGMTSHRKSEGSLNEWQGKKLALAHQSSGLVPRKHGLETVWYARQRTETDRRVKFAKRKCEDFGRDVPRAEWSQGNPPVGVRAGKPQKHAAGFNDAG